MTEEATSVGDQQLVYITNFDKRLRSLIRSSITPQLIEEHRAKPLGQHSDELERVLNYFRRPPRYGLYAPNAFEYRLISLPVVPGADPEPLNDALYTDKSAAVHAVFLEHLADLRNEAIS